MQETLFWRRRVSSLTQRASHDKAEHARQSVTVFYDSALILSATDTSYASGMIALDVSTQVISFTNILVTGTGVIDEFVQSSVSTLNFRRS